MYINIILLPELCKEYYKSNKGNKIWNNMYIDIRKQTSKI